MIRRHLANFAGVTLVALVGSAAAADLAVPTPHTSFYLHVGPAAVLLDESASLDVAGQRILGADILAKPQLTLAAEVGYFLKSNFAVSFTGGLPPLVKVEAGGSIHGLGNIGKAVYGPMTLTGHYHFLEGGAFQPYLGAGVAYMHVFDTKDGMVGELKIDNAFGPVLQAGLDLMLSEHWGIFVDVKKAFLRTDASGAFGSVPVSAKVTLDPLVVHTGIAVRF